MARDVQQTVLMRQILAVVMALALACQRDEQSSRATGDKSNPTSHAAPDVGSIVVISKRSLAFDSENTMEAIHQATRTGDKDAFRGLMVEHGGHLLPGTKVRVVGYGASRRRIEIIDKSAPIGIGPSTADLNQWWVDVDTLSN